MAPAEPVWELRESPCNVRLVTAWNARLVTAMYGMKTGLVNTDFKADCMASINPLPCFPSFSLALSVPLKVSNLT